MKKLRMLLAAALTFVLGWALTPIPPKGQKRPLYRQITNDSSKWKNGHNAGCVLYAPPNECICEEFDQ